LDLALSSLLLFRRDLFVMGGYQLWSGADYRGRTSEEKGDYGEEARFHNITS